MHSDSSISLEVIQAFATKCSGIEQLFAKIDQIDEFVQRSKEALKQLEAAIGKAEADFKARK